MRLLLIFFSTRRSLYQFSCEVGLGLVGAVMVLMMTTSSSWEVTAAVEARSLSLFFLACMGNLDLVF